VYAHLDEDLSSPVFPGETGRHPLPVPGYFSGKLGQMGIGNQTQVIVYDDLGGAIAARLWWMLRWLGHKAVAVLDGGWQAWIVGGFPTSSKNSIVKKQIFQPNVQPDLVVDANQIMAMRSSEILVDSRSAERYLGLYEPIDQIAGHIPGAVNAYHGLVVTPEGRFHSPKELRTQFQTLLAGSPPDQAIFYCGSGVTAARNILAMEYAGLHGSRLYAGSWSEWITDETRLIETAQSE
jgi:thiosulfate/3-mercaptopyruvate sulfurtransferase